MAWATRTTIAEYRSDAVCKFPQAQLALERCPRDRQERRAEGRCDHRARHRAHFPATGALSLPAERLHPGPRRRQPRLPREPFGAARAQAERIRGSAAATARECERQLPATGLRALRQRPAPDAGARAHLSAAANAGQLCPRADNLSADGVVRAWRARDRNTIDRLE